MIQTPNPTDYAKIKHNLSVYNKILKYTIREAKLSFYNRKFYENRQDPKKTWNTINEAINRNNTKTFPNYMVIDNNKITDNSKIANSLNDHFNEIGKDMANSIEKVSNHSFQFYLKNVIQTRFVFQPITKDHIRNIIKELNSKSNYGFDGISSKLLKQLEQILIDPLTHIMNQSLISGIFPDKLKSAKIVSVHKKGYISS